MGRRQSCLRPIYLFDLEQKHDGLQVSKSFLQPVSNHRVRVTTSNSHLIHQNPTGKRILHFVNSQSLFINISFPVFPSFNSSCHRLHIL